MSQAPETTSTNLTFTKLFCPKCKTESLPAEMMKHTSDNGKHFECKNCHSTFDAQEWVKASLMLMKEEADRAFKPDTTPVEEAPIDIQATESAQLTAVQKMIADECDTVKKLLISKNRKYGNSALEPMRCFSKADPVEGIKVRLDDKLSRLHNEQADEDEDVIQDIIGYLILLQIAKKMNTKDN